MSHNLLSSSFLGCASKSFLLPKLPILLAHTQFMSMYSTFMYMCASLSTNLEMKLETKKKRKEKRKEEKKEKKRKEKKPFKIQGLQLLEGCFMNTPP